MSTPHPALKGLPGLMRLKALVSDEEATRFSSALVPSLGAVHAAVGLSVATFGDVPLWAASAAGFLVFWYAHRYLQAAPLGALLARAYLAPVAATAVVYWCYLEVGDWSLAAFGLLAFYVRVLRATPLLMYLACVGYACLSADRAGEKPPSPLDKPS